ncbi:MAG: gene transfer agent family protein [Pseudomonadota bacterium]
MNPFRGEVPLTVNGHTHVMRLTLGALVAVEAERGPIPDLIERLEAGRAEANDVLSLLHAGLNAGGWTGEVETLLQAEIEGGYLVAVQSAALLLKRGFGLGEHND